MLHPKEFPNCWLANCYFSLSAIDAKRTSEVHLDPNQTPAVQLFCENS